MAITVNLYTFSKKVNSTARPTGADKTYQCTIKEPCGIMSPVIKLDLGLLNAPNEYNYAFVPMFGRYYFINEWTFEFGLWNASLNEDTLATYKYKIGEQTMYVLRSAESYNLDIADTTYFGTNNTSYFYDTIDSPWDTTSLSAGRFIIGIAGKATTYYIFRQDALDVFLDWLFSDWYIAQQMNELWFSLFPEAKIQSNPIQHITSIMWFPFIPNGTDVETIRVGYVNVPCVAQQITDTGISAGDTIITVRKHPQDDRGKYLNNNPYSNYYLFFPPWGKMQLDADIMANSNSIFITWVVDLRTGAGTLVVTGGKPAPTHVMSWIHSQIGVGYQISQVRNGQIGLQSILSPVVTSSALALTGNEASAVTSGIVNGISAIGDMARSKIPSTTTVGSNGGIDSLRGTPMLQYEFKQMAQEDIEHRGRPLCENMRIDMLSGYILVKDADISLPSTQQEQDTIKNYLEGGFFYE